MTARAVHLSTTRSAAAALMIGAALGALIGCGGGSPDRPPNRSTVSTPTTSTVTAPPPSAEGVSDIFTVTPGGGELRQVTRAGDGAGFDTPSWSPRGDSLAASGPPCDDCPDQISIIPLDGDAPVVLSATAEGVDRPSYAPSGDTLAYVGGGNNAVYVANADGSQEHAIIDDGAAHTHAVWSPDGRTIAFTSQQPDGGFAIELAAPDGSARRVLATRADWPSWSPDGRRIAFTDLREGRFAVAVMDVANGQRRRLTDPTQNSQQPSWAPDGRRLVFTRVGASDSQLVIINADGTGARSLRLGVARVSSPRWSPTGDRIAFTVNY